MAAGWLYAAVTCLVAYQASQELIGMVTAKGIAEGMKPPPPLINRITSLLCVLLNLWVFVSGGRAASAMAVRRAPSVLCVCGGGGGGGRGSVAGRARQASRGSPPGQQVLLMRAPAGP